MACPQFHSAGSTLNDNDNYQVGIYHSWMAQVRQVFPGDMILNRPTSNVLHITLCHFALSPFLSFRLCSNHLIVYPVLLLPSPSPSDLTPISFLCLSLELLPVPFLPLWFLPLPSSIRYVRQVATLLESKQVTYISLSFNGGLGLGFWSGNSSHPTSSNHPSQNGIVIDIWMYVRPISVIVVSMELVR